jgi:hypothetical protein
MTGDNTDLDIEPIRRSMASFQISPRVEPNEAIDIERVFFPEGHRGVLDTRRQLVVGNRGMGKSFWTHALTNLAVRERLAKSYSFPKLAQTHVIIGFNGSVKLGPIAPSIEEIQAAQNAEGSSELIWRAIIWRAVLSARSATSAPTFSEAINKLKCSPGDYAHELTAADDELAKRASSILIVFDALDRLAREWGPIREMTKGLLITVLGLQSFQNIRAKVFMRVDQYADNELFQFPDSSKIRNDRVDLAWRSHELYGLLLFELLRQPTAKSLLNELARRLNVYRALPNDGRLDAAPDDQEALVTVIAGEFMGKDRKRGRVYTWVPLHLGDAANNCSPRTFLTAWKTAAEHVPSPTRLAVDYLGLNEGVRQASSARLTELREDYPWIDLALNPLRRQFVPIQKTELFHLWVTHRVVENIVDNAKGGQMLAPIGVFLEVSQEALLQTMTQIAVMEERANGKINVPDIFRIQAEILRKGGVAVPRKS